MDLQGFDDAMLDASTGLTHVALTERVNSLSEMLKECFHSQLQSSRMKRDTFVKLVMRKSLQDGMRQLMGLTELQRCKQNYAMLNMILDEWMPWHKENPDFPTIEVESQHLFLSQYWHGCHKTSQFHGCPFFKLHRQQTHWPVTYPPSSPWKILECPVIRNVDFHCLLHPPSVGLFSWSQETFLIPSFKVNYLRYFCKSGKQAFTLALTRFYRFATLGDSMLSHTTVSL